MQFRETIKGMYSLQVSSLFSLSFEKSPFYPTFKDTPAGFLSWQRRSRCLFVPLLFVTDRSPRLHTKIWWRVTTTKWTRWQDTRIKQRSLSWSTCFSLCWTASLGANWNESRLSQPRLVLRLLCVTNLSLSNLMFGFFLGHKDNKKKKEKKRKMRKLKIPSFCLGDIFVCIPVNWAHFFSPQPNSPLDHRFSTYQVNVMQSCDLCGSYIWGMERAYMCSGECKKSQKYSVMKDQYHIMDYDI